MDKISKYLRYVRRSLKVKRKMRSYLQGNEKSRHGKNYEHDELMLRVENYVTKRMFSMYATCMWTWGVKKYWITKEKVDGEDKNKICVIRVDCELKANIKEKYGPIPRDVGKQQ